MEDVRCWVGCRSLGKCWRLGRMLDTRAHSLHTNYINDLIIQLIIIIIVSSGLRFGPALPRPIQSHTLTTTDIGLVEIPIVPSDNFIPLLQIII